ncbi:MAG: carbohydrate ABC transporter substrate-binding protein [Bacillati bacterium ANGP1]|uniref:Probable sugar-binding periplasmic protein n=1 Tax=Candidatus Segetimicrobium genomatis TaxID=2569760 RepID=A0A537JTY5_9BACT|nr:MAG: carbohydrate ABC transporter substrate-binding protein [Terrabacteria group bacterium ANGP1]
MTRVLRRSLIASAVAVAVGLGSLGALQAAPAGKLEIFSWWTAGGEAEALNAVFGIYHARYPAVQIVNATVAGGAGTNAKAVLKTRMLGGDPPDSFQVHAGHELIDTWVRNGSMEPLTGLFKAEGWTTAMPRGLLDILSYKGDIWSVPVNIHRANVLWYNKKIFADAHLAPPATFDEFFKDADALKAKGIVPFALGDKEGWEAGHAFEAVLIAALGADGYRGLWTGTTPWTGPKVTAALEIFKRMLAYANTDHAALTWDGAGEYIMGRKGAMMIMGDWANGWFTSKNFNEYGWAPPPGNMGVYDALSDSFGLPKKVRDRENVMAWLRVLGSREGQQAFNPLKGSICARTDCSPSVFGAYQRWAMTQWTTDAIVPSVIHGAAASEGWATDYKDAIALFVTSRDTAATQQALAKACVNAGVCK